jgi:hypothetical protein
MMRIDKCSALDLFLFPVLIRGFNAVAVMQFFAKTSL